MLARIHRATAAPVLIAALSFVTTACLADVDATGRWVIRGPFVVGTYVVADDWTQSGTALTTSSGCTGTIAPMTRAFSMTRPPLPLCGTDTRSGTVSADGQSLSGTEHIHPTSSPTTCLNGIVVPVTGSRCPNSTIEFGEECDDGNVSDGDGCDNTCALEPCWSCAGTPSVCAALPSGTPCDAEDGISCTVDGGCDGARHCVETPTASLCDDGNPCTIEACGPLVGCLHNPNPCDDGDPYTTNECLTACVTTPRVRTDCRKAMSSKLLLKSPAAAAGDTLTWTWTRGQSTRPGEFADPQTTASYEFCLFAGAAHATVAAATLPPDPSRWQPTARGFNYRNPAADEDGIARLKLVGDDADRSKVMRKGQGALLDITAPPVALPIRAQLINSQTNLCWTATYDSAAVRRNEAGTLSAKTSGP